MNRLNKKGFTLIELLAVLVVLGIVVSISVYAVTNSIKKTKAKGYQVTIKEIENTANDYLIENSNSLFFVSSNDGSETEYQCVTIGQLIDAGYFKSDIIKSAVSDDSNVMVNDFVIITRNQKSKVISDITYIKSDDSVGLNKCAAVVNANADIRFEIQPDTWSKTKTVKISYILVNNANAEGYIYGYSYDGNNYDDNKQNIEFTVNKNASITAYIKSGDTTIKSSTYSVSGIDTTKPTIKYSLTAGEYNTKKDVKITITDNQSGFDYMNIKVYKDDSLVTEKNNYGENIYIVNLNSSGLWKVSTQAYDKVGNSRTKEVSYTISTQITESDFNYTGQFEFISEDENNWHIKFLSGGSLTVSKGMSIEAFLVGGGGGGGKGYYNSYSGTYGGAGGGGGYIATNTVTLAANEAYEIIIGEGGAAATDGGATTAFGLTASGGGKGNGTSGGAGTGAGGNGTNGKGGAGGAGQAAFGDTSYYYGAGGGAGGGATSGWSWGSAGAGGTSGGGKGGTGSSSGSAGSPGLSNSGGGGGGGGGHGGGGTHAGGSGGSGIVIIRNAR